MSDTDLLNSCSNVIVKVKNKYWLEYTRYRQSLRNRAWKHLKFICVTQFCFPCNCYFRNTKNERNCIQTYSPYWNDHLWATLWWSCTGIAVLCGYGSFYFVSQAPFTHALLSINLVATGHNGVMHELSSWCFSVAFWYGNLTWLDLLRYTYHF